MKVTLYVLGWLSLFLALVTLADASSAIGQGVAVALWTAALVGLAGGAICGRLDRLPKAKDNEPADPRSPRS